MAHNTNKSKPRLITRDSDNDPPRASSSERPRRSFKLPLQPLLLIDGLSRKSFSYDKLPEELLKLSVLKLDGSCFDIEVAKTANVAQLRLAVEKTFGHLPQKGPGKVSWPHVWGHFCLSYNGQKLVTDSEYVRDYGIKDGDQLQFTRHVSISYNLIKKRPKKGFISSKQRYNVGEQNEAERLDSCHRETKKLSHCADQGCFTGRHRTKTSKLFAKWFSRCRIAPFAKKQLGRPSEATTSFVRGLKESVVRCCTKKWGPRGETLRKTLCSKRYFVKQ